MFSSGSSRWARVPVLVRSYLTAAIDVAVVLSPPRCVKLSSAIQHFMPAALLHRTPPPQYLSDCGAGTELPQCVPASYSSTRLVRGTTLLQGLRLIRLHRLYLWTTTLTYFTTF